MNDRERAMAVLRYETYDRLPIVHFGFWDETLEKWHREGHITRAEAEEWEDGNRYDDSITDKLGFDFDWARNVGETGGSGSLHPGFERKVLEETEDGFKKVLNEDGAVVLERDGAGSIPAEVDHVLKGRREWEELYLPRLQYTDERIDWEKMTALKDMERDKPLGIYCGSLFGQIRNWLGLTGVSYLYVDDEDLYDEIINTVGDLCYRVTEAILDTGVRFDFAHFWEDICFKNGPLVTPRVFDEKVGPHYQRITGLLKSHGIDIVSLDCDGMIDALIPTWIHNGVNTMFPIEVGTWNASIKPWRETYGRELRGVGGMNKTVFSQDYAAVDREIERLRPLVDLGGYIPCPDHRIAPDAEWDNVRYYCERMRSAFG